MSMAKKFADYAWGLFLCLIIAVPAWLLGQRFTLIGGPVFAILAGILVALFVKDKRFESGITFTSKKILQYSIILLGFDMNLFNIFAVGGQSLAIIVSTIGVSLIVAFLLCKALRVSPNSAILIGVGTSICGGSAIAATAPVIGADSDDVSKAISTIFLFNIIAVFIFPPLGAALGMTDIGFGTWAGTAINDTSSVVAASSAWSANVGNDIALDTATIVKLTRTLAIIPITLCLALYRSRKEASPTKKVSIAKIFPWFVALFLLAAIINTAFGLPASVTKPLSRLGKFMITMAMAGIGLKTDVVKLVKNGAKPIFLGFCCWVAVAVVSILVQKALHIW